MTRTIRGRLTVVYGSLFFLAGAVLIGLTYLVVWQILNRTSPKTQDAATLRTLLTRFFGKPEADMSQYEGLAQYVQNIADQQRADVLNGLLIQSVAALAVVGVIAVALGWLLAGRALQPVHRITETAKRITGPGRGLHERIDLTGPRDEMTELAETFNAMLERLDRSFDGQTRFIANASHEMRTPLAVKRALIEITISRPETSADARQLGESLLTIDARHERLIDGLLTLADSENELTEHSPIDLADVAGSVLDQLREPARTAGVTIREPALDPAPVVGDPVLLERLTQNLMENAIRHNHVDGWLSVTTGPGRLTVSNSGPVVRAYEVEVLFQPFRRLDRERVAGERGFGLGLSIARAVSRAHGGDVTAVPRPEGGLDVTVTLSTT